MVHEEAFVNAEYDLQPPTVPGWRNERIRVEGIVRGVKELDGQGEGSRKHDEPVKRPNHFN